METPAKLCSCGNSITNRSKTGFCRSCTAKRIRKPNLAKEENPAWKGYKEMPYRWFSKYFEKKGRKRTGDITIEDCYNLWRAQGFRCALSGVMLHWGVLPDGTFDISIDRINSNREYTLDNIQLVHKDVNLMKNYFTQTYFISLCHKISEYSYEV